MVVRKHPNHYELDIDDLRELTSLLGIQVPGDRRKRITYLMALDEFLSIRIRSRKLQGVFELEAAGGHLPAAYRALEF